jgi:hypothetical protein
MSDTETHYNIQADVRQRWTGESNALPSPPSSRREDDSGLRPASSVRTPPLQELFDPLLRGLSILLLLPHVPEIRSWNSLQLHRAGLPFRERNQISWIDILLSIDALFIPSVRLSHLVRAVRRREQNKDVELTIEFLGPRHISVLSVYRGRLLTNSGRGYPVGVATSAARGAEGAAGGRSGEARTCSLFLFPSVDPLLFPS